MTDSREVRILDLQGGEDRLRAWYQSFPEAKTRKAIYAKTMRRADPAFQGYKSVGAGVFELRIFIGPGYRIYFAMQDSHAVILLGGGNKRTQSRDIHDAQSIWEKIKADSDRYSRKFHG